MQRTLIVSGGGASNTYTGPGTAITYYGPLGAGGGPIGGMVTTATGTGGYGRSNFACVLSKLYVPVGKVYIAAMSVTINVNVGGTSPAVGNLSTGNPAALNNTPAYYYDATDIDAITAGQQIGWMDTLSAAAGNAIVPSRGVVCDCLNQGFSAFYMFSTAPVAYTVNPRYSSICGRSSLTSTVAASQQYARLAFVASGLQWQTAAGNTDTTAAATSTFGYNASWGSNTDSSMKATVSGASFVGQMYDATDIAAVPAGDYYGLHWTGNISSSTLKLANAGVHTQGASNNSCVMMSGDAGAPATWTGINPTYGCFNQGARFDYVYTESITVVPTSGVFAGLAVNIAANTYPSPTTFTVQNGPTSGDTGAGSGNSPTSAAGFNNTGVVATAPANTTGWFYDATDIAAFVGGRNQLLLQGNAAPSAGVSLQAQSITFTAPAHLGLLTQGTG